jgi:hypothetical protein
MLRSLELTSFKGFSDRETASLAPITLIFGANSSGKSTLLQSLLLLKQTILPTSQPDAALLFRTPDYVDLGSFENLVYAHNRKRQIQIGVGVSMAPAIGPRRVRAQQAANPRRSAQIRIRFSTTRREVTVDSIDFTMDDETRPAFSLLRQFRDSGLSSEAADDKPADLVSREAGPLYFLGDINPDALIFRQGFEAAQRRLPRELETLNFSLRRFDGIEPKNLRPDMRQMLVNELEELRSRIQYLEEYSFDRFLDDVKRRVNGRLFKLVHFLPLLTAARSGPGPTPRFFLSEIESTNVPDLADLVSQISRRVRDEISQIDYIGPLRNFPERTYIFSGSDANTVGTRGQNLPHILFARELHHAELNRLADLLELGYEIRVTQTRVRALNDVFAVRLIDKKTKIDVGLSDVGFGVSQVLPVLLESFLSSRSTVLIEQPEIHLHPRLQASLGDVFASAVKSSAERQFIIETHSEHIFLRLKTLIRKGDLPANALKVLFVRRDAAGGHIRELRLDDKGDLRDPWPDGFFDDAYHEVFSGWALPEGRQ